MIVKALLVALVYYLASWCCYAIGIFHLNRPIIIGPLIGLVLGNLHTGIILGATFESVFLGVIAVGGSVPADATIGTTIGTAVALLTGANSDTALAVAVPVAMLGVVLGQLAISVIIPLFVPKMDTYAERGNRNKMIKLHWIMSFLMSILQAIIIFIAVWLGSNAINSILNNIPQFVTHGFQAAGSMLPAVGFALLLNMLYNKKLFAFYFLGFVISIYLKLPSIAIAIIAAILAISQYYNSQKNLSNVVTSSNSDAAYININDEEDFFNV